MMMAELVMDAAANESVPNGAIMTVSTTPISVAAASEMTMGKPNFEILVISRHMEGPRTGAGEISTDMGRG